MNTLAQMADLLAIVEDLHNRGETVYVRWSRGPEMESAASVNYVTGQTEAGLSALAINGQDQGKREWYEAYPERWVAMQIRSYGFLRIKDSELRPWICTGTLVGLGGDGEPCITNVKPIAYLAPSLLAEAEEVKPLF